MKNRIVATLVALTLSLASAAFAATAVNWMPNFPMRLGAAGAMGMWMPVPGAAEYKVLRQIGGGAWTEIYKGPANNFQDPAAPSDQDVAYKVIVVVGGADAGESQPVKLAGEKAIDPPGNLSHRVDAAQKRVQLRWNGATGASFYNVYRAEAEGQPGTLVGSGTDLNYTDPKVEDGKTYWYFVTSVSATSKESKRPDAYKVDVVFPKEVVIKRFQVKQVAMQHLKTTYGEDFAAFKNPSDILYLDDKLYVACEDGIQVLDAEGTYLMRLPLVQEMVATGKWTRPSFLAASPTGNLFVSHVNQSYIHEITPDGATLVREIVPPEMPGYPGRPVPVHIDAAPDGSLWLTDTTYGNLVIIPPEAGNAPGPDKVARLGWAKGKAKYDAEKDGLAFTGPTVMHYIKALDLIAVLEATKGQITFIDWKKKEKLYSIGGIGGGLQQFSLCADFDAFDDGSVLAVDSLMNHVKRLKVGTDPKSDSLGDYLESFVDDTSTPDTTKLQKPDGGVTKLAWVPAGRRLYALSSAGNQVLIYKVP